MNIVTGTRRELASHAEVVALATGGVYKFQFPEEVDLTGKVAVAVRLLGNWARSTQTCEYPRVGIVIQSDALRSTTGDKLVENADDRALATLKAIDKIMHRPTREVVFWGDVRILGSNRETEPSEVTRPGNLSAWWQQIYDVKVG